MESWLRRSRRIYALRLALAVLTFIVVAATGHPGLGLALLTIQLAPIPLQLWIIHHMDRPREP